MYRGLGHYMTLFDEATKVMSKYLSEEIDLSNEDYIVKITSKDWKPWIIYEFNIITEIPRLLNFT